MSSLACVLLLGATVSLPIQSVRADSVVDLFAELVPGTAVTDEELGSYFGKGIDINLAEGVVFSPINSTLNAPETSTIASGAFGQAEGILQITQFNGDGNVVNISVDLTININSVIVSDSQGNTITSNSVLDFGGVLNGVGGLTP